MFSCCFNYLWTNRMSHSLESPKSLIWNEKGRPERVGHLRVTIRFELYTTKIFLKKLVYVLEIIVTIVTKKYKNIMKTTTWVWTFGGTSHKSVNAWEIPSKYKGESNQQLRRGQLLTPKM